MPADCNALQPAVAVTDYELVIIMTVDTIMHDYSTVCSFCLIRVLHYIQHLHAWLQGLGREALHQMSETFHTHHIRCTSP